MGYFENYLDDRILNGSLNTYLNNKNYCLDLSYDAAGFCSHICHNIRIFFFSVLVENQNLHEVHFVDMSLNYVSIYYIRCKPC